MRIKEFFTAKPDSWKEVFNFEFSVLFIDQFKHKFHEDAEELTGKIGSTELTGKIGSIDVTCAFFGFVAALVVIIKDDIFIMPNKEV